MNSNAPSPNASIPRDQQRESGSRGLRATIGAIVCRGLIPLWILAGASFKLIERNPNLLPAPVKSAVGELHSMLGAGTLQDFMSVSMRSMIAVEFILAAGMIFLPRVSRGLAIATLGFFIAILGWLIWTKQDQCGCFGASGPSPRWMLVFDSALLLLAILFAPAPRGGSAVGFVVTSVLGAALAFGLPDKAISMDLEPAAAATAPSTAPSTGDQSRGASKGSTGTQAPPTDASKVPAGETPPPSPTPPAPSPPGQSAPVASEWPPVPAKPKGFYLPDFKKWTGQRLSEQPTMHMLRRPLPEGIDQGRWHVIFYRLDCDHCQVMLDQHFAGKLATKTLLVSVPDASPGAPLENRVTDAVKTQLMRGANGPDYVIGTPVVVTVVDGVIKAVCEDPAENEASLKATLDAK